MSLLDSILKGRPNGLRSKLKSALGGAPAPTTRPPSAVRPSAPASSSEPAEKALGLKQQAPKHVTPPDGYEVVLHKDALEPGKIIEIIIGGTAIAVARVGDVHYAIANACAHAQGPLGEGSLDDCIVTCPYHGWQYDVTTGKCKTNPNASVKVFDVKVVGDAICVQI